MMSVLNRETGVKFRVKLFATPESFELLNHALAFGSLQDFFLVMKVVVLRDDAHRHCQPQRFVIGPSRARRTPPSIDMTFSNHQVTPESA
jgi:hypothetical protein